MTLGTWEQERYCTALTLYTDSDINKPPFYILWSSPVNRLIKSVVLMITTYQVLPWLSQSTSRALGMTSYVFLSLFKLLRQMRRNYFLILLASYCELNLVFVNWQWPCHESKSFKPLLASILFLLMVCVVYSEHPLF